MILTVACTNAGILVLRPVQRNIIICTILTFMWRSGPHVHRRRGRALALKKAPKYPKHRVLQLSISGVVFVVVALYGDLSKMSNAKQLGPLATCMQDPAPNGSCYRKSSCSRAALWEGFCLVYLVGCSHRQSVPQAYPDVEQHSYTSSIPTDPRHHPNTQGPGESSEEGRGDALHSSLIVAPCCSTEIILFGYSLSFKSLWWNQSP